MQLSNVMIGAVLFLAGATQVMAASSVELNVGGLITPSACTPSLSNNGVVDHGRISVHDLEPWGRTQLPDATLTFQVTCQGTTLIAIKATDNRAGTAGYMDWATSFFGVGLASNNKKVGWYALKMNNPTADDVAGALIESPDGKTWVDAWDTVWQPNWMRAFNGASEGSHAPLPIKSFKADLVISTGINNKQSLPVGEEVPIDGSATLDVVYL